jgi:hypothetical protein
MVDETVHQLTPDMGGRWLVTTQGTTHVWDLDAMTYLRQPGPTTHAGAFPHDGTHNPSPEWSGGPP